MGRMVLTPTAPAPTHLSERTRGIWQEVVEAYDLREGHHLAILQLGLEAIDRADEARARLAAEGLFVADRYGSVKAHPAEKVCRDSTIIATRCFRELALSEDFLEGEPRIPRVDGSRS
jgi:hypothetical protein